MNIKIRMQAVNDLINIGALRFNSEEIKNFFSMKSLSQDEINELIAEMYEQIYEQQSLEEQPELDFAYKPLGVPNITTNTLEKKECDHQWKNYHGLNESFEYCTVCDVKK